ncbi:hypothetical protein ABZ614_30345 [Streptomyces sp. NPDC013178]|uniref:effector-associated constant component EACC1 n=1 Tax=unclassified Streptomyces TaxID=2593676 RepID=UPI0033F1F511
MTTIQVTLGTEGDNEEDLRSLLRWLTADEVTGRHLRGALVDAQPAHPEHMGGQLDVLSLAVSSLLGAAQLAMAVVQWRAARRSSPTVTVHRNGTRLDIHAADPETVRRLALLLADDGDGDAGAA